jgi:hypothetical protein
MRRGCVGSPIRAPFVDSETSQLQLTAGKKTWLYKLPKLPPILVPPPEGPDQIVYKGGPVDAVNGQWM